MGMLGMSGLIRGVIGLICLRKIRAWWIDEDSGGCWDLVEKRGEGRREGEFFILGGLGNCYSHFGGNLLSFLAFYSQTYK